MLGLVLYKHGAPDGALQDSRSTGNSEEPFFRHPTQSSSCRPPSLCATARPVATLGSVISSFQDGVPRRMSKLQGRRPACCAPISARPSTSLPKSPVESCPPRIGFSTRLIGVPGPRHRLGTSSAKILLPIDGAGLIGVGRRPTVTHCHNQQVGMNRSSASPAGQCWLSRRALARSRL